MVKLSHMESAGFFLRIWQWNSEVVRRKIRDCETDPSEESVTLDIVPASQVTRNVMGH